MDAILDAKLLILIGIANAVPVAAKTLFGNRLAYPLDGHAHLADGQPLFGHSKSVRGIVLSLAATAAAAPAIGVAWTLGTLVAALAMLGDVLSSFLKRRMKLAPSSMALGLDQLPESLLPAAACALILHLTIWDVLAVTTAFFALELLASQLLFRLRLRDTPY